MHCMLINYLALLCVAVAAQQSNNGTMPDYMVVSPDYVALSSSGTNTGLSADGLNNMMCLVNRRRFYHSIPALALAAELVRLAQARAEYLAKSKPSAPSSQVIGTNSTAIPNPTGWDSIVENTQYTLDCPTKAQWTFEMDRTTVSNMLLYDFQFFGAGYQDGHYVQLYGRPKELTADPMLFPLCPANETFADWVFSGRIPGGAVENNTLLNKAFPYAEYADAPVYKDPNSPDTGRLAAPCMGTNVTVVPFLQSLDIPQDIVAPANSSTPYAAIGYSGILGLSKDDLNDLADKLNAHRSSSGLHPLALHPALVAASQAHSYSMNRAGNMTSYDPSGSLAQRVDRHGFDYGALGEMVLAGTHGVTEAISQLCAPGSSTLSGILSPEYAYMGAGRSGQFWTVQLARGRDGGPL